ASWEWEQGGIVRFEPVVERWALQACFSSGKRCAVRNARVRGDFANRYVNTKVFHVARGQGYQLGLLRTGQIGGSAQRVPARNVDQDPGGRPRGNGLYAHARHV